MSLAVGGWNEVTLGALAESGVLSLRSGYAHGGHSDSPSAGVPHLRPFNVTEEGSLSLTRVKYVPSPPKDSPQWLRPGDVLFNNTNSEELTGKTALFDRDVRCTASNHMTVIRIHKVGDIDPVWLAYLLQHLWSRGVFRRLLRRYVAQSTVALGRLKSLAIPLPTGSEQQAIAHVLRTVQRAKEQTDQVIGAARELEPSLTHHLFSSLLGHGSTASRSWPMRPLGACGTWLSGGTPSTARPEFWSGDIPWITASSLTNFYLCHSRRRVTEEGLRNGTRLVPAGTTIFVVRGMSLRSEFRVGIATRPVAFGQDCKAVVPSDDLDPVYFAFAVRGKTSEVLRLVDRAGHGTGRLQTEAIKGVSIPLPPLVVQKEIAGALAAADRKVAAELQRREGLDQLFKTLLHELMTGRIRLTDWSEVA